MESEIPASLTPKDEGIKELIQLLDREVFAADSNQLTHLVADILVEDVSKEDYFKLVYLSAKSEKFARVAANAITILNAAKISFSGKNFQEIRIPNAYLQGGYFDHTHFERADLSGVNFADAWLRCANLRETNLKDLKFGEFPSFDHFYDDPDHYMGIDKVYFQYEDDLLVTISKNSIRLWQFSTHKLLESISYRIEILYYLSSESHSEKIPTHFPCEIIRISLSRNKERMVCEISNGTIQIWDLPNKKILKKIGNPVMPEFDKKGGHSWKAINSQIYFDPERNLIVYRNGKKVFFYNLLNNCAEELTFNVEVTQLAVNFERSIVVSGCEDGNIYITNLLSKEKGIPYLLEDTPIKNIRLSSTGTRLLANTENYLLLWDLKKDNKRILEGNVDSICISANGEIFAVSHGNVIKVCDFTNLLIKTEFWSKEYEKLLGGETILIDIDSNGEFLMSQSFYDHTIKIWEIKSIRSKQRTTTLGHVGDIKSVEFQLKDGISYLVSRGWITNLSVSISTTNKMKAGQQGVIRYWAIETGKCIYEEIGKVWVDGNVFSGNLNVEVFEAGNYDDHTSCVKIHKNGQFKASIKKSYPENNSHTYSDAYVHTLSLNYEGNKLALLRNNGLCEIYNIENEPILVGGPWLLGGENWSCLNLSPDGKILAVSVKKTIIIINMETAKTMSININLLSKILAITISNDGMFAVGCADSSVQLWETILDNEEKIIGYQLKWTTNYPSPLLNLEGSDFTKAENCSQHNILLLTEKGAAKLPNDSIKPLTYTQKKADLWISSTYDFEDITEQTYTFSEEGVALVVEEPQSQRTLSKKPSS
jgi:WD40 repeat protein